jgi:hypothetical protein
MVSEDFIKAMGIPLRADRTFRAEDEEGTGEVIVISERLALQHFPNEDPVGPLLYSGTGPRRIVGVVGDVRPAAPGAETAPWAYLAPRHE